jgi:hypothetical protein
MTLRVIIDSATARALRYDKKFGLDLISLNLIDFVTNQTRIVIFFRLTIIHRG